ncbi:MAG TPA: M20/M25/M40 family metallo-hydrolase [Gemmatimonadales bacterium]|nr:M20/M25/M40 family metallo-hydrolase [Gemmatimonadales bacterium]
MKSYGLDTSRANFTVYLPYPDSTVVEMVSPVPMRLNLGETALAEDTASQGPIWPAMNGHAGSGDVTADLVYVNYGLPADYRLLDSLGISVRGKIAIARYGRSFRGIKAREAEARGASALLLYSDPQDDGYVVGDIYPDGPMRPPQGVQRGSVLNSDGDPSTPDGPSLPGVKRLTPAEMDLPRIPVVPIGYGNAGILMQPLRGVSVPSTWQGGLPFHYHVGSGEVVVHLGLWHEPDDSAWRTITNTIGVIRGTEWPDELVLVGAHRDAWGPGAEDNVSGVVSVLEAARMIGEAARRGYRPKRTIVFATWDAEEWGLFGSTEWVESREAELTAHAVAYLNLDVSAGGPAFGADGTASLQPLIRELTRLVQQPYDSVSIYAAWRRQSHLADTADVELGDLGGGSDFAGFYNHLGIPSAGFGFGGPGGIYHSAYDSYDWMRRFGDPGYQEHVAAATLAALFLERMANADLEPFDYVAFAGRLGKVVRDFGTPTGPAPGVRLSPLQDAIGELQASAVVWDNRRDSLLAGGGTPPRTLSGLNASLRRIEQLLTRSDGLPGRSWFRNLIFAADRDNGYATVPFPGVAEAVRDHDADRVSREVLDLADRIRAAAAELRDMTQPRRN